MTKMYVQDLRKAKYCLKGSRRMFKRLGLDWQDFLKNGIDVEELEKKVDDAMVTKFANYVRNKRKV
ncbi:MAG: hypothetical protein ACOCQD_03515 [archaeon]